MRTRGRFCSLGWGASWGLGRLLDFCVSGRVWGMWDLVGCTMVYWRFLGCFCSGMLLLALALG